MKSRTERARKRRFEALLLAGFDLSMWFIGTANARQRIANRRQRLTWPLGRETNEETRCLRVHVGVLQSMAIFRGDVCLQLGLSDARDPRVAS